MNNEDDKIIKRFITILVIVILVAILIYAITKFAIKKDSTETTSNTTNEVSVDNSVAIVGTMLKKSEKEYYCIIYNKSGADASTYAQLITNYKKDSDALSVYTVDLSNNLNAKYYSTDGTNVMAENISDLKFGDITLLYIKDGKINKAYESLSSIKKVWKLS